MKRFTELYMAFDRTNRTSEKVAAMERYFREAPARDAAYALFFLAGNRFTRVVKTGVVVDAALRASGIPEWLMGECHEAVGDFSETVALLLPGGARSADVPLHTVVEEWILPLVRAPDAAAAQMLTDAWSRLGRDQRMVFNKLVRGNLRAGVSRGLVVRALAAVAGIDPAVMAHRVSGKLEPTEAAFLAVMSGDTTADQASRPYPFCLANQLNDPPETLGDFRDWQVEYKWDGIRAQALRRTGPEGRPMTLLWSRGEELVTAMFPEIAAAAGELPVGTVLDGEIMAWRHDDAHGGHGSALSFNALQTRLNRKNVQASLFDTEGVVFLAFDLIEHEGADIRGRPLVERRRLLEELWRTRLGPSSLIKLAPTLELASWEAAAERRASARADRNAEGLMLKHRGSIYHVGRVVVSLEQDADDEPRARQADPNASEAGGRGGESEAGGEGDVVGGEGGVGGWWKWKIDPLTVDAVLMYAQPGSGKRAGLFTDYTFGVWDEQGRLTPFAKAYSGLDDEEIRRVDAFVRQNTTERIGPLRVVRPELVFEIGFEGIRASTRHRSGVAVRFPRILRWRTDKRAEDADRIEAVRELLRRHGG